MIPRRCFYRFAICSVCRWAAWIDRPTAVWLNSSTSCGMGWQMRREDWERGGKGDDHTFLEWRKVGRFSDWSGWGREAVWGSGMIWNDMIDTTDYRIPLRLPEMLEIPQIPRMRICSSIYCPEIFSNKQMLGELNWGRAIYLQGLRKSEWPIPLPPPPSLSLSHLPLPILVSLRSDKIHRRCQHLPAL